MVNSKQHKRVAILAGIAVLAAVCSFGVYRTSLQAQLDHGLIQAIKQQNSGRIQALLREGASGAARENDPDSGIPRLIQWIKSRIRRQPAAPGAAHRSALLLYYEVPDRGLYVTSMDVAPRKLNEGIALALLDAGAPTDEVDELRYSALYWAAAFQHHSVVRALLERGANPNLENTSGQADYPLNIADYQDTERLIEHGAHLNACDSENKTALYGADSEKTLLLLEYHAATEIADTGAYRQTPLLYACASGSNAVALALADHGASLTAKDSFGATPFIRACGACKLETVQALAKGGADIRARDMNGTTALIVSLDNEDPRVFDWLISQGPDVNAAGIDGSTALSVAMFKLTENHNGAANRRYRQVVALLQGMGAKPPKEPILWYGEEGD